MSRFGQDLSRFLFRIAQPVSGYDIATIVQATMREKENARLAQGSFIHRLIEEALFEFNSIQNTSAAPADGLAPAGAPLDADLFGSPVSPAALPAGQEENLAALDDDDERDSPTQRTQRRRLALGIVILLALAAASVAWFTGLLT